MSLAHNLRREMEEGGEYVIRANADSGWFAVYPPKLEACLAKARARGRSSFNLVVYRTRNNDERDHFVIPASILGGEFVEDSLTTSAFNGKRRWNCTLRNEKVHVTHTGRSIDVARFHRNPLITEKQESSFRFAEEIQEGETFSEGGVTRIPVNRYERDNKARQRCIEKHGSVCAVCGFNFSMVYGDVMRGFIHVHHVKPLCDIGKDYQVNPVTDLIPVCPNCHAVIHSRHPPLALEDVQELRRKNIGEQESGPS